MTPAPEKKERIWEIDALRGLLILCVPIAHALYCGEVMLGLYRLPPALDRFLFGYAGTLFVILSGLSATLGSRSFRRGLLVLAGGLVLTLGSIVAVLLGFVDKDFIIYFGVLHLLGVCMMLWPLLRRLSDGALLLIGMGVILLGGLFAELPVKTPVFYALGLCPADFVGGDYFPIFPQLGWFCLGAVLGRIVYADKTTRLPQVDPELLPLRFLRFCGRHSLIIFVLHLPVVGGIMYGIAALLGKL